MGSPGRTSRWEPSSEEILDLSHDLLAIAGFDGYLKRVNEAFERVSGCASEQALSRPFIAMVHTEDRERVRAAIRRLESGHSVAHVEMRLIRADGSTTWIEWGARPAPAGDVFWASGRDVTDRKRTESLLQQARREVDARAEELHVHVEQQAALRRVATLVARGASQDEILHAVAAELHGLFRADRSLVARYEPDGTVAVMASEGNAAVELAAGARVPLAGESAANELLKTARPVRVERREDDPARWPEHLRRAGISTSIAAPIVVQGGLWGGVAVVWRRLAPPGADDAERRLPNFAELAGSAIANAESRTELQRRIDEQEALRRVATLVARGVSPSEVQDAVAAEVCRLLDADETKVIRYEADNHITILAASGDNVDDPPVGSRFPLDGDSVSARVWRTSRAARKEDFSSAEGQIAHIARLHGVRSTVGAPIVVDGRLWGLMIASWTRREPPAPDTESRLAQFTDLVAMALANAESRAELTESRARVVATADATRRRIERDLHDGAQQRLVALALDVRAAQAGVPRELGELKAELSGVVERLTDALEELREIAHGIHPGLLAQDGLAPALRTLARQSALPVELDLEADVPLPEAVEVAAYYVVSEALTNASKHANASEVRVDVRAHGGVLEVCVSDDGRGGAELTRGSGLLGLRDRASAIGGQLSLASAPGQGTSLRVTLPLAGG